MATAIAAKPAKSSPPKFPRGLRARTYAEYLLLTELGKLCYKTKDALLDWVVDAAQRDTPVQVKRCHLRRRAFLKTIRIEVKRMAANLEGKTFQVRDKFAERNSIPVGQNARRFEIEEI